MYWRHHVSCSFAEETNFLLRFHISPKLAGRDQKLDVLLSVTRFNKRVVEKNTDRLGVAGYEEMMLKNLETK